MKKSLFIICSVVAFFGFASCNTEPQQGVVLGNPNIVGKAVRIVPSAEVDVYLADLKSETTAEVSRIQVNDAAFSTVLESVTAPYTLSSGSLSMTASFSNGRTIEATATVTEASQLQGTQLKEDGSVTSAVFDLQQSAASCRTGEDNFAIIEGEDLCSRVVNVCHAQITCSECRTNLLATPLFVIDGTPLSLQQVADRLDAGTITKDEAFTNSCLGEIAAMDCESLSHFFTPADRTNYSNFDDFLSDPNSACSKCYVLP